MKERAAFAAFMFASALAIFASASAGGLTTMSTPPPRPEEMALTITTVDQSLRPQTVVTIRMNGSVEFGPGFTADEAAREFWQKVGIAAPCAKPQEVK